MVAYVYFLYIIIALPALTATRVRIRSSRLKFESPARHHSCVDIWTSARDFGNYLNIESSCRIVEQLRLRQTCTCTDSLEHSLLAYRKYRNADVDLYPTLDLKPNWIRQHGHLKEASVHNKNHAISITLKDFKDAKNENYYFLHPEHVLPSLT